MSRIDDLVIGMRILILNDFWEYINNHNKNIVTYDMQLQYHKYIKNLENKENELNFYIKEKEQVTGKRNTSSTIPKNVTKNEKQIYCEIQNINDLNKSMKLNETIQIIRHPPPIPDPEPELVEFVEYDLPIVHTH